jgi:hypothetical protein
MRWLSLCSLLVCGCGAEAALAPEQRTERDVSEGREGPATETPAQGNMPLEPGETALEPADMPNDRPVALEMSDGQVEIRGLVTLEGAAPMGQPISVGLRWVLEESLFPRNATTGIGPVDARDGGEFALVVGEPLAAALVANEATERSGVGVAYLTAYFDGDANGVLGCDDYEGCLDGIVGTSPNVMVVYAEEAWPAEGAPLFGFNGAAGVRPTRGWSLVHMTHNGSGVRPTARAWSGADTVELVILAGSGSNRDVQLDID